MRTPLPALAGLLVLLVAVATGCPPKSEPTSVPTTTTPPAPAPAPEPEKKEVTEPFAPAPPVETKTEPSIEELNRQGVLRTIYFLYDSADLDATTKATLQANAAFLKANPYKVEIGGHCDERGTIEYNIALGNRRAASVRDYLASLGVGSAKMTIVSYGEEKPVDPGHDESAWSKNRRAEFTILSKM